MHSLLVVIALAPAADVTELADRVKAVGREGAGNPEAAAAWKELSRRGTDAIVPLLAAIDGASPAAANWLRSAIDAIIERETAAKRPLPAKDLEAFLRDTKHAGSARRLSFELICRADPAARERLLPTFLNDPGSELRYDAVEVQFEKAKALPKDSEPAKDQLRKLLDAARDVTQTEAIAKELEQRGSPVDLAKHFAFITSWYLASPFDNTDGKGFNAVYAPERGVDLAAKYPGKDGREVAWKPHTTAEKNGAIDLNKAIAKEKNAVAYGYVVIDSPAARPVEIRAASATALKIWLNGKEVFARETYHQSFEQDSHIAPATLLAGRNTILIKVCQNNQTEEWAQNWMYQLRLTDPVGTAIPVKVMDPAPAK
ncbi:MAG TPA: hypothetical protein VL371_00200 [Gemmataceae bacterium]|jgi:hypothetical protein|nr:hypothetical protein [Gemmataceae bacterium]